MKKATLPIIAAMIMGLMAAPAAWAGGGKAADLTKQCQEAVKQNPGTDAAKLCQEGITLQEQGKDKEAVAKMQQGLAQLQPAKAPTGKPY
jgi:hypothetical protein